MNQDQQFWAMLIHKRDEGLAHITAMIERSGIEEVCQFLAEHVMPKAIDEYADDDLVGHVIAHMALVGAIDALLAFRDQQGE